MTVQAYDSAGDGALSAEVSDSTLFPPEAPVASITSGGNWVRVGWNEPSSDAPILGCKLYRVLGDVHTYFDDDLATGTYVHAVVAFSDAGDSDPSNVVAAILSTTRMCDPDKDRPWWMLLLP